MLEPLGDDQALSPETVRQRAYEIMRQEYPPATAVPVPFDAAPATGNEPVAVLTTPPETTPPAPIPRPESQTVFTDPIPARMLNEFVYCPRLFYYACREGIIYYRATKQRVRLAITDELEAWIHAQIEQARRCATGPIPPPARRLAQMRPLLPGTGLSPRRNATAAALTGEITEYVPLMTR